MSEKNRAPEEQPSLESRDLIISRTKDDLRKLLIRIKKELPEDPGKPNRPTPEEPGTPTTPPIESHPGGIPGTGNFPEARDGGWINNGSEIPTLGNRSAIKSNDFR